MPLTLPPRPNLDQLKHQAKDLLKGHRAGDPAALRRVRDSHPRFSQASEPGIRAARFTLSGAQLVIAVVARSDASEWEHIADYPSRRKPNSR